MTPESIAGSARQPLHTGLVLIPDIFTPGYQLGVFGRYKLSCSGIAS